MERSVVFFVGPTGCGKTTYRRGRPLKACISPDDFIVGKWTLSKASSAWAHARNTFVEILRTQEQGTVVVDAQFVDPAARREWTQIATAFGYAPRAIIFNTPFRQILANHKKRGDRGGYGKLPYQTIVKTCRSFREQLKAGEIQRDFVSSRVVSWGDCLSRQVDKSADAAIITP